jgi:outer membrane protein
VFTNKLNQRRFTARGLSPGQPQQSSPLQQFPHRPDGQPTPLSGRGGLSGYRQARLGREAAASQVLAQRQKLIYRVTQAYFGRQLAEARLQVTQEARKTAAANRSLVQARFDTGAVVRADVLSADVHLARLTQEELAAAGQVEIARSALATAVGAPEVGSRSLAPAPREAAPLTGNLETAKGGGGEAPRSKKAGPGGPHRPAGAHQSPAELSPPAEPHRGI